MTKTLFFNKYTNWEKDLTYKESQRKDLSYYTIKEYSESEYNKIVDEKIDEKTKELMSV